MKLNPQLVEEVQSVLALLHSCQIRAAIAQLDRALENKSTEAPLRHEFEFMLVRALHDQQDLLRLRTLCERLAVGADGSSQSWTNVGYARVLLGDPVRALVAYRKAESLADPRMNLTEWLRAVMGRINCVCQTQGPRAALEEFKASNLEGLSDNSSLTAVNQISIILLQAFLMRESGDFHGALNFYWRAYGLVSKCGSLHLNYSVLFDLAKAHLMIGEIEKSRHYFSLVEKGISAQEMIFLSSRLHDQKAQMPYRVEEIQFDRAHGRVMIGQKWIDFGRQSILLNLFEILAAQSGQPVGHEELARLLWDEEYDPRVHDNKIYVTIRRLRELLEPSAVRSTLILKDRQGYVIPFPVRGAVSSPFKTLENQKIKIDTTKENRL